MRWTRFPRSTWCMRFARGLCRLPPARAVMALMMVFGVMPARAFANGRFPESQRLLEHPGNPDRLYLAATFGLLVTEDRGKNWYSLCEEAFALKLLEGDPSLEVMSDGSLLSGIYESINRSSDCGCTWNPTLGASEQETVWDIAMDGKTGAVVALLNDATTFPGRWSVHESTDRGKTWHKLSDLPVEIVNAFTLEVAPSDSSRIYVSGITTATPGATTPGLLLVSTDHGATWQKRDITGADIAAYPFIAGVDPTRPDRIYVRTDDWNGTNDVAANDALLYSDDGGKTWRELARRGAKLFGFALSPDGATVLIGYGDPVDAGGRTTNPDDFGIYKASTAALTFEKIHPGAISCLRWTGTGVYACVTEDHPDVPTPGMAVGFAPNASFTLATANPFTSLLSMKNVRGPLACAASVCIDNWKTGSDNIAALCQAIRATCDIDPTKNVLACVATGTGGAGGTGATGGASGGTGGASGGTGGAGVDAATDRDAATGGTGGGGGGGGCGCRTAGAGASDGAIALIALLALIATERKWRRRNGRRRDERGGSAP